MRNVSAETFSERTNSSANILAARETWSFGAVPRRLSAQTLIRSNIGEVDSRIMSDIIEVPLPRACSRRLMSFFTFQISMFFSASLACGALIVSEGGEYRHSSSRC